MINEKKHTLMKKIVLFLLIIGWGSTLLAQSLSEKAVVSVITCSAGEELYSAFGHSAIRFYAPEQNLDLIYNYGTFSFNTPDFYPKFIQGELDYYLSVNQFERFVQVYTKHDRAVYEQVLNLSTDQKRQIFKFLTNNYRPENRYYRYKFFFDNCATRVVDVFKDVLTDSVKIVYPVQGASFRDKLNEQLRNKYWQELGVCLVLGAETDRLMTGKEYTFLPDYVYQTFDSSFRINNGIKEPLVEKTVKHNEAKTCEIIPRYKRPGYVFAGLLLIVLIMTFSEMRIKKHFYIFDFLLFTIVSLLGMLIIFLWFFTEHQMVDRNYNLLWASPFHLIFVVFFFFKKKARIYCWYFGIYSIILLISVLAWFWLPQYLHPSLIFVAIILLIRSLRILYFERSKALNK